MKIIPTKVHGLLDYPWGVLLICFPWIFQTPPGAASTVPVILGILLLVGSMTTDYEAGLLRIFTMRFHLGLDIVSAIFLGASPWIFGFADTVREPYLIIAGIQLLLALLTRTTPGPVRRSMGYDS